MKQANPLHTKDEALRGASRDRSEGIEAKLPGKVSKEKLQCPYYKPTQVDKLRRLR